MGELLDDPGRHMHFAHQPVDAADGAVHHAAGRIGLAGRIAGGAGGVGSARRHLLGGGAHLGYRGHHLIRLLAVALHLPVRMLAQAMQPIHGPQQLVAGLPHLAHHRLDPLDEAVEGGGQLPHLVLALHLEALGQIPVPVGDVVEGCDRIRQRAGDPVADHHGGRQGHPQDHQDEQHPGFQGAIHGLLPLAAQGGQLIVDVVDVEARAHDPLIFVEHQVEGELGGIPPDRGLVGPVLREAISFPRRLDDPLNEEGPLGILVLPAVLPLHLGPGRQQHGIALIVVDEEVAVAAIAQRPQYLLHLLAHFGAVRLAVAALDGRLGQHQITAEQRLALLDCPLPRHHQIRFQIAPGHQVVAEIDHQGHQQHGDGPQ